MNQKQELKSAVIVDGEAVIEKALSFASFMHFRKNEDLFLTGDAAKQFYYLEKGAVEVSYASHKTTIIVAMIGAGAFFGEIGFFDQNRRVRTIRATEDSELYRFDQSVLQLMKYTDNGLYGDFMHLLFKQMCGKFRSLLDDRMPLTAYSAALSTGKQQYQGAHPIPASVFASSDWLQVNAVIERFKSDLFNISYQLQKEADPAVCAGLHVTGNRVLDDFNHYVRGLESCETMSEHASYIWGYIFKETFPYIMRSRMAERAYYKPRGYAGDYMMMEMIYRNQPEGDGKLGELVDGWMLNSVPAKAVRARRSLLRDRIEMICRNRLSESGALRIMNLACGPSRELFDMIGHCDFSEKIEAICIDIDPEALTYVDQYVDSFPHKAMIRLMSENIVKWSLGYVNHDFGQQDIIYSSGLTDYLDEKLCLKLIARCYEQLKPGGVLMVGNFSPRNPDRMFMDNILYWRLIHRDETDMHALFDASPFGGKIDIVSEEQGVNIFAIARK